MVPHGGIEPTTSQFVAECSVRYTNEAFENIGILRIVCVCELSCMTCCLIETIVVRAMRPVKDSLLLISQPKNGIRRQNRTDPRGFGVLVA